MLCPCYHPRLCRCHLFRCSAAFCVLLIHHAPSSNNKQKPCKLCFTPTSPSYNAIHVRNSDLAGNDSQLLPTLDSRTTWLFEDLFAQAVVNNCLYTEEEINLERCWSNLSCWSRELLRCKLCLLLYWPVRRPPPAIRIFADQSTSSLYSVKAASTNFKTHWIGRHIYTLFLLLVDE